MGYLELLLALLKLLLCLNPLLLLFHSLILVVDHQVHAFPIFLLELTDPSVAVLPDILHILLGLHALIALLGQGPLQLGDARVENMVLLELLGHVGFDLLKLSLKTTLLRKVVLRGRDLLRKVHEARAHALADLLKHRGFLFSSLVNKRRSLLVSIIEAVEGLGSSRARQTEVLDCLFVAHII